MEEGVRVEDVSVQHAEQVWEDIVLTTEPAGGGATAGVECRQSGLPETAVEAPLSAPGKTDCCSMLAQVQAVFPPQRTVDVRTYSPLALAFLGDGVYSLIIRTMVVQKGNRQAEKLHNETRELVSAKAQARIGDAIEDLLTPEEHLVYRRGRNASPEHHAKNATMEEYMKATALETLCGWLYLQDRISRLLELLKAGMERTDED